MTYDGWHFAAQKLRDGSRLTKRGERTPRIDDISLCQRGYHASARAIDALAYAPGFMVSRVRLFYANVGDDKAVGCERLALTDYVDARQVVLELAARWAHRAISVHAAHALRSAGLTEHADRLAAIPAWRWEDAAAARAAADDARAAASAAAYAAYAARAAVYAVYAVYAAVYAASAAFYAASAAVYAADDVSERDSQNSELESAIRALVGPDADEQPAQPAQEKP